MKCEICNKEKEDVRFEGSEEMNICDRCLHKIKCCWNEEEKVWYETETISPDECRCLGCCKKHKMGEEK